MRSDLSTTVQAALQKWLADRLAVRNGEQRALMVATALDIEIGGRPDGAYGEIRAYTAKGDEELLDIVHVALGVLLTDGVTYRIPPHEEVERILALGRSIWTATEDGLVHRSEPTGQAAFERAVTTPNSASTELAEAWNQAHARAGNPGDAWDHAIKAVEAVLIPIVVPKKNKPNLGDVIGQLRGQPHLWKLLVRGQNRDHGIEPLVAMLTLLWPDPNRHGSPTPEPAGTLEEGRALANIAVTIVQWARDGLIVRR